MPGSGTAASLAHDESTGSSDFTACFTEYRDAIEAWSHTFNELIKAVAAGDITPTEAMEAEAAAWETYQATAEQFRAARSGR